MLIIPFTMFLEVAQGPHDSLDLLSPLITFLSPVPWKCGKKKKILCRGPEISERCANMEMCNRHIFPLWRNYEESKGRKCLTGICRKKNGDHHRGKWGIKGEEWGLDRNLIWNGTEVLQCWKKNDDTMEKGRKRK